MAAQTEQEQIDALNREVKRLRNLSYLHFAIIVLGVFGVTSIIMSDVQKIKKTVLTRIKI